MSKAIYLLIGLSVSLSAIAQVFLKHGATGASAKPQSDSGNVIGVILAYALNPFVIFGLFVYFLSAAVWLLVLAKVPLSTAYPFVSLGFVLTAVMGRLVFHDTFSVTKVVGTLVIVVGVVIMGRSA